MDPDTSHCADGPHATLVTADLCPAAKALDSVLPSLRNTRPPHAPKRGQSSDRMVVADV